MSPSCQLPVCAWPNQARTLWSGSTCVVEVQICLCRSGVSLFFWGPVSFDLWELIC
jgi:hypothetical protein